MPPQNQSDHNVIPESQVPGTPEEKPVASVSPEKAAEKAPQPISPEAPKVEQFSDQASAISVPPAAPPAQPQVPVRPVVPSPDEEEKEAGDVPEMDKSWVSAVDTVIEKDKDKPYEEEEDSEKLQVDYLQKRFGKKVDKE